MLIDAHRISGVIGLMNMAGSMIRCRAFAGNFCPHLEPDLQRAEFDGSILVQARTAKIQTMVAGIQDQT
jgi:hypothetical protein